MELYEKIKFIRLFRNWSQEEIANKLDISVNAYAKIERGETDVNISRLQQIAETLGVELADLFNLNDKNVFHFADIYYSHNWQVNQSNEAKNTIEQLEIKHEIEKLNLMVQQQSKEIEFLKKQIAHLEEIIRLKNTID